MRGREPLTAEELAPLSITLQDFRDAVKKVLRRFPHLTSLLTASVCLVSCVGATIDQARRVRDRAWRYVG